jgi:hypothetical protein
MLPTSEVCRGLGLVFPLLCIHGRDSQQELTSFDLKSTAFPNDMIYRLKVPTILNRSRWAQTEKWPHITLDIVVKKLLVSACPSNHGFTETKSHIESANRPVSPVHQPCCHCLSSHLVVIGFRHLSMDGAALYCLSDQPICNLVTWNSHVRWNPHKFYLIIELLKVPALDVILHDRIAISELKLSN